MIWQVKGNKGDDKILGLTNFFCEWGGKKYFRVFILSKLGKVKCFKFQN